jgi:hypothetical protein
MAENVRENPSKSAHSNDFLDPAELERLHMSYQPDISMV